MLVSDLQHVRLMQRITGCLKVIMKLGFIQYTVHPYIPST